MSFFYCAANISKTIVATTMFCVMATSSILFSQPSIAETKKKNIIVILTDDQRFDEIGLLNPNIDSPHLDKIAQEGAFFKNAFVTTSLCSPSRASILTGQYASKHGVIDNNAPRFNPNTRLFPELLQETGYDTAFIGKWHIGLKTGEPQPGFNHWISFPGQGSYLPKNKKGEQQWLNINGSRTPQMGYITDELTDYALDWLNTRSSDSPFMLFLSHKAVHSDFIPAERHKEQYANSPISFPNDLPVSGDKPMWVQNYKNGYHGTEFPYYSDLDIKEYKRNYHRAYSAVDESLGEILSWLKNNELEDETLLLFLGDNGFLFGEHGMIDKRNAYEESMRIPLVAYAPGTIKSATVVEDMVANIDVAPTLLEFAGIQMPEYMQGRSFADLAKGVPVQEWRTELLYQYYWEWVYPHTPTTFALRTDKYKLIQYHGIWDTDELYDLSADPREKVNLIRSPEHQTRILEMRQRLHKLIVETGSTASIPFSMKLNHGLTFRNENGSTAADFPESMLRNPNSPDLYDFADDIRAVKSRQKNRE